MKFLLIGLILFSTLLLGNAFKETRYIKAFDIEQVQKGDMTLFDDILTLKYTYPNKKILNYESTKLIVSTENEITSYSYEEYPQIKFMSLIIKSIVKNDYALLEKVFDISKSKDNTLLSAKSSVSDHINSISVGKNKTIIINMANDDIITIETSE